MPPILHAKTARHSGASWSIRHLIRGLLLLLWCLTPHTLSAQSTSAPLPLAAYQERLAQWQADLATAEDAAQVTAVQRAAATVTQIILPSGTVITIQPLLGDPMQTPIDRATAQARVAAVSRELVASAHDDTAARLRLLNTILARPEFVEQDSLWQRFWRWLRSWLPNLPESEGSAAAASPFWAGIGWTLIAVAVLLLVWLLSYWLQNLLGRFIGSAERRVAATEATMPQTAATARTAAHQLANAGSYREAVRHLYLSALLALHERNLIHYQSSDTNREVLTAVHAQPHLYAQLRPVVETFDDVWYGVHEPDRASFDRYVVAVEKLNEVA